MEMVMTAVELRKALVDIEVAERNGFMHCLAVVELVSAGSMVDQCKLEYRDLIEKAHGSDGKVVPIKKAGFEQSQQLIPKNVPVKPTPPPGRVLREGSKGKGVQGFYYS